MRITILLLPVAALAACSSFSGDTGSGSTVDGGSTNDGGVSQDAVAPDSNTGGEEADAGSVIRTIPTGMPITAIAAHDSTIIVGLGFSIGFFDASDANARAVAGSHQACVKPGTHVTGIAAVDASNVYVVCGGGPGGGSEVVVTSMNGNGPSDSLEPFDAQHEIPSIAVSGSAVAYVLLDAAGGANAERVVVRESGGSTTKAIVGVRSVAGGTDAKFTFGTTEQLGTLPDPPGSLHISGLRDVARGDGVSFASSPNGLFTSALSLSSGDAISLAADKDDVVWLDGARHLHASAIKNPSVRDIALDMPLSAPTAVVLRQIALAPRAIAVVGDGVVTLVPR